MTDTPIEPALTSEEWASPPDALDGYVNFAGGTVDVRLGSKMGTTGTLEQDIAKLIALANAALPSDDPRKFTHLDVEALRETARVEERALYTVMGPGRDNYIERLRRLADVLESYLPPEK